MATITVPEFDSTAYDTLTSHLQDLHGLSNCATVLAVCEFEASGPTAELIDIALPSLGRVMGRLAQEAKEAAERLWTQNEEMRRTLQEVSLG
jgi:hypothetical protein